MCGRFKLFHDGSKTESHRSQVGGNTSVEQSKKDKERKENNFCFKRIKLSEKDEAERKGLSKNGNR